MQNKILKLFVIFILLFSLRGYSQTNEESKHPLLDKYYPRAQNDTSTIVTNAPKPIPQIIQPTIIKPVPIESPVPATVVTTAITTPVNTIIPLPETKIVSQTMTAPAVVDTTAVSTPTNVIPIPETRLISETIPIPAVSSTSSTNNSINPTVKLLPVQNIVPRKPETPAMDTRLGSSTPAYDTWKKNSNGAGSVTTSIK